MNHLGIDPGLSGALALLDEGGFVISLKDMPTLRLTKSRREIDGAGLVGLLEDFRAFHGEFRATVETAGARPGQHAASGLKTGVGWGIVAGILYAQKVSWEPVSPQRWQKAILGKVEKGTAKDRSRAHAQRTWPAADLGGRKTQDRSDALCIALYGWQQWTGRAAA